jgi:uncharacterized membrane protein
MNQMLVAVFDSEKAAFKGLGALKHLHDEGGVSLYASAVIVKDETGKVSVKEIQERPLGGALGLLLGSLIGTLGGGPVGFVIGADLGGVTGFLLDAARIGVRSTFLEDASKALTPGKAAVLAEIEESWTSLVDDRLREHGGMVFRQFRVDVVEDQLAREGAALEANLRALQDELDNAAAEDRTAIQRDIERVKMQIEAMQDRAKARLDQAKAEMDAKIKLLQEQAKEASNRAKARIEKRIADVKADYDVRSKKLNQAWTLTKEALAA